MSSDKDKIFSEISRLRKELNELRELVNMLIEIMIETDEEPDEETIDFHYRNLYSSDTDFTMYS